MDSIYNKDAFIELCNKFYPGTKLKSEKKCVKNVNYEIGKYYLLNLSDTYFIPTLQTHIKFTSPVAVKLTNFFLGSPAFGKLVIIQGGGFGTDLELDVDVELGELGEEYKLNSREHPLFYMDFAPMFNKEDK